MRSTVGAGLVAVVLVVIAACWKPFAPPRPAQRAFEPRIHAVQLANGLQVVAIPTPRRPRSS